MEVLARLANLPGALPGACAQGLIWGIMAIGVYLTYRILDVADLTVDNSFGTGGAVCVMALLSGQNVWTALILAFIAGLACGLVTGLLHTFMGIPAILAGILTQLALYSVNLKIMGKSNQSINVDKYDLLISLRWVKEFALHNPVIMVILISAVLIGLLYWFFGTELGCAIRATGNNQNMVRAQGVNTDFTKLVESCGAMVVADRYCFGSFPSRERIEIAEGETAFEAIARHYLHWNQCARFMAGDKIDQRHTELKRLVDEFQADGVVYESMKFCEFWSYEKVLASHVLQNELGVPCCTIEKEYALGSVGQLRTRFQAFVESLEIKRIQAAEQKEGA